MAYKIYPTSKFSRGVAHFYKRSISLMLQLKELGLAGSLHGQKAWEELAEDPFRGLRAGPVTFSPFLFFPASRNPEHLGVASQILEKQQSKTGA
jgi:hypothetical protein